MGIDIYARWNEITEEEEKKQYTGFSVTSGDVGYLREAYHGGPYATRYLVKEAFESEKGECRIPAKILKKRLSETLKTVKEREIKLYKSNESDVVKVKKSFIDFVKLCEKKEKETGKPCIIIANY